MIKEQPEVKEIILKELHIQNFATIINEKIQFLPALNCIVGETGSGKSLILEALQLVFGSRADKKVIRKGCDSAIIEAVFTTTEKEIQDYFNQIGFPFVDNQIIVKRIIAKDSSRTFLNFQNCPNTVLSKFSKRFVDLVGQFDNQKLLTTEYQLKLLDEYCGHKPLVSRYAELYLDYKKENELINDLKKQLAESSPRMDYVHFQIDEINRISPTVEEETELTSKKEELKSSMENQEKLQYALSVISESDRDVLSSLGGLKKSILGLSPTYDDLLLTAINKLEDLSFQISKSLVSFNEKEYEEIADRLDSFQKLKRKFGGDMQSVLNTHKDLQAELHTLSNLEKKIEHLEDKFNKTKADLRQSAEKLHENRIVGASRLAEEITHKIQTLNMQGSRVELHIERNDEITSSGVTGLKFMAETNAGEGLHDFKEIASGGELSRMLLSLRTILSSKDSISIFLFDEIDTGIGGKTAKLVGRALSEVSSNGQVIAITHLPQIAHFSNNLIHVDKKFTDSDERTSTKILEILDPKDRDRFVSTMADFK